MPKSEDEKRAEAAERARKYRARKRAEADVVAAAKRDACDAEIPTTIRDAVADALEHMKWLVPSDAASVAQAKSIAEDLDRYRHERDDAKALSAHAKLSRVLNDLGGTPLVRLQRELRSLKNAPKPEGDDERNPSEGAASKPGNVTQFERPSKRQA
ncbi:terminase small subunit [Microbacterium sp. PA5]|uniref:terminase small subunit n=1 Tax=Microbacterium sp. PA5 TaxID=3416654 RepID=UPI003CF4B14A